MFGDELPPLNSTVERRVIISDPCPDPPSVHYCAGIEMLDIAVTNHKVRALSETKSWLFLYTHF